MPPDAALPLRDWKVLPNRSILTSLIPTYINPLLLRCRFNRVPADGIIWIKPRSNSGFGKVVMLFVNGPLLTKNWSDSSTAY